MLLCMTVTISQGCILHGRSARALGVPDTQCPSSCICPVVQYASSSVSQDCAHFADSYTCVASPWYGDHIPLTLLLTLLTGLFDFLLISPVESRSISTLPMIWFESIFLRQTGLVLPLM